MICRVMFAHHSTYFFFETPLRGLELYPLFGGYKEEVDTTGNAEARAPTLTFEYKSVLNESQANGPS